MIRVIVADDHPVVRQGLCTMLEVEDDIMVIGEATDGVATVQQTIQLQPDIVLLDVQMPRMDGIMVLRQLRQAHIPARVIILTTYHNEDYIFPALQEGARGYLLKDVSREELAAAIRTVAAGHSLLDPENVPPPPPECRLTPRELDVLALMAEHYSNIGIAEKLFLSENTVKTHVKNIMSKLGCNDRAAAVLTAWKRHLIPQ